MPTEITPVEIFDHNVTDALHKKANRESCTSREVAENRPKKGFGPNGTTFHIHLSVRGALRDFRNRELKGMFCSEDGRELTVAEAKDFLRECLAQGKEVLPFGEPCEGFDFAGGGCPGHEKAGALPVFRQTNLGDV